MLETEKRSNRGGNVLKQVKATFISGVRDCVIKGKVQYRLRFCEAYKVQSVITNIVECSDEVGCVEPEASADSNQPYRVRQPVPGHM